MTQCNFLSDSPLPGNISSWKSTPVSPHTLRTCGVNGLCSNNIHEQSTGITMYNLAVSELPVVVISWKFLSWTQRSFRIPKIESIDLVCDYIAFTQFQNYMFVFYIRRFWKHSSHFSSIDVTPFILRWWRILCAACGAVWSGFVGECDAGGFMMGVCVGIIWVAVKEFKCLLF